jgi:epoxyqueuosine reductase
MSLTSKDRDWIKQQAHSAGFDLAGLASVSASEDDRFTAWIDAGHAGEMDYLTDTNESGELLRGDLRRPLPWAHSVLVCAINYNSAETPRSIDPAPSNSGWIARYAWSGKASETGELADRQTGTPKVKKQPDPEDYLGVDYHDILLPRLRAVEASLKQHFPEVETRCYVDTGPILERGYAARAGIGWIGKNTCVLNEQQGSWLLLGVIVTSLSLEPEAAALPAADRCGSCTRCIDACPTDALLTSPDGSRQMDATRCIAYLTIEKKGSIPEDLRAPMGRQVFGCDICQDVCPWNKKSQRNIITKSANPLPPRPELINPDLTWLASLEGTDFTRIFRGSPIERNRRQTSRRRFFRRNIAIAMGNSGNTSFLPQLDSWSAGDDPILSEAAAWAAARLRFTT